MFETYFQNRVLVVEAELSEMVLRRDVPQGSVLGPLLWNFLYDGILRLRMPCETEMIAYADDLALMVTTEEVVRLVEAANESVERVIEWMDEHGMELAAEKTGIVVTAGRGKLKSLEIRVKDYAVQSRQAIKYLSRSVD